MNRIKDCTEKIFEEIKHIDENGNEYWFARELQKVLEYKNWRNFNKVIDRAIISANTSYPNQNVWGVEVNTPISSGKGKIVSKKCHVCGGAGYSRIKKTIKLHIPGGINSGQQIRVSGMGEPGTNGGKYGDLYVEINVKAHTFFKREGNDIHVEIPVDFTDVILGKKIEIPTVYGEESLEIPAGTQIGTILKMRGKGIKDLRTQKPGDQFVHLNIKIPTSLNRKQKQALEDYLGAGDKEGTYDKFKKTIKK